MLSDIAPLIKRIIRGENLTSDETAKILTVTSREDTEGYYYLAFTAAILTKGLTEEELSGLVKGLQEFAVKISTKIDPFKITDVSGSGGDVLKTFNVSTATALVSAAAGNFMAKQSFRAFTSVMGSSDIFQTIGVKFLKKPDEMAKCLEEVGIVPLYYPFLYKGMETRLNATARINQLGLKLPTPMHPIALVPAPIPMKSRLYGLFSEKYMEPIAHILQKSGYYRGMIVHGVDGLDEVSNIGLTKVVEFSNKKLEQYELSPEEMGLKRSNYKDISSLDKKQNIINFLRVVSGRETGPKGDIVLANAGASLYITGKASNIKDGVELARQTIDEGKAAEKLEDLIVYSGDANRLQQCLKEANIL